MRKTVVLVGAIAVATAGVYLYKRSTASAAPSATAAGSPGAGRGGRAAMPVEVATAARSPLAEHLHVVGNLVGTATVQVVPKVSGRLASVRVRIGDTVSNGQVVATVEDNEVREQVRQAEGAFQVSQATIRQREADLKFSDTNLARAQSLFDRQLVPRQTLDDAEARQQAAVAQLDLARAQNAQSSARLQELRITLSNTVIRSPVTGFVGARFLDPGAFASSNQPILSVVDIQPVRLVASLVERDFRRVRPGILTSVEVDAFPGEQFNGQVARVAPIFDPATRTAQMEIEVPNPNARLKPGMYARVSLRVAERTAALAVPRNAIVERAGARVIFVVDGDIARERAVETGIETSERVEITAGLAEGDRVVTVGAAGVRDGDRVVLPGSAGRGSSATGQSRRTGGAQ